MKDWSIKNEHIRLGIALKKRKSQQLGLYWCIGRPRTSTELKSKVLSLHIRGLSLRAIERRLNKAVSKTTIGRIVKTTRQDLPKES